MISEKDFKKYEEIIFPEEPEENFIEIEMEKVYEIIECENIYDVFPNYDLQDERLAQDILEVYKILFWGISALVSTLLWLYFIIYYFSNYTIRCAIYSSENSKIYESIFLDPYITC